MDTASRLSALALQSEFGDFEEEDHGEAFISEFRWIPNQSESFENLVLDEWKSLRPKPTPPASELGDDEEKIEATMAKETNSTQGRFSF